RPGERTQLHRAQAIVGGAGGIAARIAAADLGQGRFGVGLLSQAVLRQPQLEQRAGCLLVGGIALQQRAELRGREFVVLGGVVALAQPVQRVRGQRAFRERLQEIGELARGRVVLPGLEHFEGGLVRGTLGVADLHRGRWRGRLGGRGGGRRGRRDRGGRGSTCRRR